MKRQTESGRTLTIRINHSRSTALERSANITGWGERWLKPVLRWKKKKKKQKNNNSPLVLLCFVKIQGIRFAWRISNSSMHQNSNHINQDPTTVSWNKMRTQQQDPYWSAGATDIQQLNPNGPDQRQSIEPQPIVLNMFRPEPSFHLRHDPSACN